MKAFEAALSATRRRPPGARACLGTARAGDRAAHLRHRPRRRGDHAGADLLRGAQHDRQGRRHAGVRRRRPGTRNIDLDAARSAHRPAHRAIMPAHFAGLPCDMDALYALAAQHRLRVIEDAALAIGSSWKGKPHRQLRRHLRVQLPPQQEHHHDRGRRAGRQRRARGARRRGAALPRHHAPARRHARRRGGRRQVQPDRRQRRGRPARSSRGCRRSTRSAARSPRATSSASAPTRRASCRIPGYAGDEAGHSWHMFAPLLPLPELAISRQRVPRRAGGARHRHRHVVRGRAPGHRLSAASAISAATSRTPSASPTRP